MSAPAHRLRTRVRYGETDQMGVVYHANYFVYFELGRTELLRREGVSYARLEEEGIRLPVVEATARFLSPARYDDEVEIETRLAGASGVRLTFEYTIRRPSDGRLLAEGRTVLASADPRGRPRRLPGELRERLARALRANEQASE